ncbi:TPA: IS3 family transposase [Pseudomonas aeruginosa]|nr:IS3 family transposase [Pseudomonas aeruginosa]
MRQQQHLLEQDGIVGKVVGARFHGAGLYRLRPRSAASVPGAGGYATDQCRRAASSTHLHPEADSSVEGGDYGALTFQDRWWLESAGKIHDYFRPFLGREELRNHIFDYIEMFNDFRRRHGVYISLMPVGLENPDFLELRGLLGKPGGNLGRRFSVHTPSLPSNER